MRTLLLAAALSLALAAPASAGELLANPGLETAAGDGPASWAPSTWGTGSPLFTWSTDAHSGQRSVKVDVSNYNSGDSKWLPDPVPVTGGSYYTFSDWYKSNANTAVSVYYETATDPPDGGKWANLFSGVPPRSEWTQYRTGFTMPAGAVRAVFVHFLARNGFLATDDYSLQQAEAPAGFSRPMISLTFDDGSAEVFALAFPELEARGFRSTQYIPTKGLADSSDEFLMTPQQIQTMAAAGHEIGSHSITHPDLTTLTDAKLAQELADSRSALRTIAGGAVDSFAYPFGAYDARVIAAAQTAGYESARSVEEGYNGRFDLEPYDIRGQNITSETTVAEFTTWIQYAKAHNYWLVVIYHEVVPDRTPVCTDPETVSPCLGDYDTTLSHFQAQLDALAAAGLRPDVMTVGQALKSIDAQLHAPTAGRVQISPDAPATGATVTATPEQFADPDGDGLTLHYRWLVNGNQRPDATGATLDLAGVQRGDLVRVETWATDRLDHQSPVVAAEVTVANARPVAGSVTLTPSLAAVPSGFSDPDGDALTYAFAWFVNSVPQPAASGAVAGDSVRVEARAADGHGGTSEPATATVTLLAPPAPVPTSAPAPVPTPAPDTSAPRISIASPRARTYALGRRLTVKIACADSVQTRATLRRRGSAARSVRSRSILRLSRAGTYVLRVTAKDRAGNAASKSVTFRVRSSAARASRSGW